MRSEVMPTKKSINATALKHNAEVTKEITYDQIKRSISFAVSGFISITLKIS
jgi:hypothetical protein